MVFGEMLKELRKEKNISQVEMAKIINRSQGSYSDWENKKTEPDIDALIKLANFFGCSIDYLVGREDDCGNIILHGDLLNNEEKTLINNYNQLSVSERLLLNNLILALLKK